MLGDMLQRFLVSGDDHRGCVCFFIANIGTIVRAKGKSRAVNSTVIMIVVVTAKEVAREEERMAASIINLVGGQEWSCDKCHSHNCKVLYLGDNNLGGVISFVHSIKCDNNLQASGCIVNSYVSHFTILCGMKKSKTLYTNIVEV